MELKENNTPSLLKAKEYIYTIDFSMIIEKMVNQDGWNKKSAIATCDLYRNFLFLNYKYPDHGILPPSIDIDEFWHYHILDTQKYAKDCQTIFGRFIHHYPYLVMDHKIDNDELNKAFEHLQALHTKEFGEPIYETRSRIQILWQKIKSIFI